MKALVEILEEKTFTLEDTVDNCKVPRCSGKICSSNGLRCNICNEPYESHYVKIGKNKDGSLIYGYKYLRVKK